MSQYWEKERVRAEQFLQAGETREGAEWSVLLWNDTFLEKRGLGPRVAEVSVVRKNPEGGMAGGSFMQSDGEGLLMCAAIERLMLAYRVGDDACPDHVAEQEWLVNRLLRRNPNG